MTARSELRKQAVTDPVGVAHRVAELEVENQRLREALKEIHEIAAREWKADETNYEWYGDIAGIVETLGIVTFDA